MATILFDTLKYAKRLEASGMPAAQAAAIVELWHEALLGATDGQLAGKPDAPVAAAKVVPLGDKIDRLLWMTGIVLALEAANFAKQFF